MSDYSRKPTIRKWQEGIEARYQIIINKNGVATTAIQQGGEPFIEVISRMSGKPKRVLVMGWDYAIPTALPETISPREFRAAKFHILEALHEATQKKGTRQRYELRHSFTGKTGLLRTSGSGYKLRRKKIERPVPVNVNIHPSQKIVAAYFGRYASHTQSMNEMQMAVRASGVSKRIAHMLNQARVVNVLHQKGVQAALVTRPVQDAMHYLSTAEFIFHKPELLKYVLGSIHSPELMRAIYTRKLSAKCHAWNAAQKKEMEHFLEHPVELGPAVRAKKVTMFILPSTRKHRGAKSFMFFPKHIHARSYKPKKPLKRFVRLPF